MTKVEKIGASTLDTFLVLFVSFTVIKYQGTFLIHKITDLILTVLIYIRKIDFCSSREREITERKKLFEAGLKETEQLHDKLEKQTQKTDVLEEIIICDVSNKICYLSMVCYCVK